MVAKRRGRPSLGVAEKFYFCIAPGQREQMLQLAEAKGISAAELIRQALQSYMAAEKLEADLAKPWRAPDAH